MVISLIPRRGQSVSRGRPACNVLMVQPAAMRSPLHAPWFIGRSFPAGSRAQRRSTLVPVTPRPPSSAPTSDRLAQPTPSPGLRDPRVSLTPLGVPLQPSKHDIPRLERLGLGRRSRGDRLSRRHGSVCDWEWCGRVVRGGDGCVLSRQWPRSESMPRQSREGHGHASTPPCHAKQSAATTVHSPIRAQLLFRFRKLRVRARPPERPEARQRGEVQVQVRE